MFTKGIDEPDHSCHKSLKLSKGEIMKTLSLLAILVASTSVFAVNQNGVYECESKAYNNLKIELTEESAVPMPYFDPSTGTRGRIVSKPRSMVRITGESPYTVTNGSGAMDLLYRFEKINISQEEMFISKGTYVVKAMVDGGLRHKHFNDFYTTDTRFPNVIYYQVDGRDDLAFNCYKK